MNMYRSILLASVFAAGCSSMGGLRDEDRLALYTAHAGAPVDSMRFTGALDGWTPLGDEHVVLWTRPNRAYLLRFTGLCPNLDFATALAVSSQFQTVYARFDSVTPLGAGVRSTPCRIAEIRPVDVAAVKEGERAMRGGAALSARPAQGTSP